MARALVLFALTFFLSVSAIGEKRQQFWDTKLKGTYYFQPKAAINNFWYGLDWARVDADFAGLKKDGFNTIILFIPWGFFQTQVSPITYREEAFGDLERLLTKAATAQLKVILRVGTHDHIPADAQGAKWLAGTVLTEDKEWRGYRDLIRETAARTKKFNNILFMFWTFEDVGYQPENSYHQFPSNVKAFHKWLHRTPLEQWNKEWGEHNKSYEEVVPPDNMTAPINEKKIRTFLTFSDSLLSAHLLDACRAAKEGDSKMLFSFQPRPEINWGYDFAPQYRLPDCYDILTMWFSPYQSYLFGDSRSELDGATLASYIPKYIERARDMSGGLPVFIDQFNFRHFGGAAGESRLANPEEEHVFVKTGLPLILRDTLGYALWNHNDYYLNVISDSAFRFGFAEWKREKSVLLHQDQKDGPREVILEGDARLSQFVGGMYADHTYTLEFDAAGSMPGQAHVQVRYHPVSAIRQFSVPITKEFQRYKIEVKTPPGCGGLELRFSSLAQHEKVRVRDILLYPWIDSGGLYDISGEPRSDMSKIFGTINTEQ